MTRSIATWIGIGAICLAILFIPIWNGAIKAAEDAESNWLTFSPSDAFFQVHKDCTDDFKSQRHAQRFFLKHGGPKNDPYRLDPDRNGKACEDVDY